MIKSVDCEDNGVRCTRFDPRRLKYDKWGIPILSVREVETVATELLEVYCPEVLETPRMSPVAEILDKLKTRTQLSAHIVNLGYKGTAKVIGRVSFRHRRLYLDESLLNSRGAAFRFTAAHEIGHWILHRYNYENWKFGEEDLCGRDLEHDERSVYALRRRTPREWLEFQAGVFAASTVTPRQTFARAICEAQKETGIYLRNLGSSPATWEKDCHAIQELVKRVSQIFQVSKDCVRVRMKTLDLLNKDSDSRLRSVCE